MFFFIAAWTDDRYLFALFGDVVAVVAPFSCFWSPRPKYIRRRDGTEQNRGSLGRGGKREKGAVGLGPDRPGPKKGRAPDQRHVRSPSPVAFIAKTGSAEQSKTHNILTGRTSWSQPV